MGLFAIFAVVATPSVAGVARAQSTETVTRARAEFVAGADFVKAAQWGEALAAFERSYELRPHSLTTYNIGACERALARYTRARRTLLRALRENEIAGGAELPRSFAEEATAWLAEIERILGRVRVHIEPRDASVSVDGKALEKDSKEGAVFVAGLRAPGPGDVAPSADFEMLVDPGLHVLTLARRGFSDVVVSKTWAPGARAELRLVLDRLPAQIRVSSNRPDAAVSINGMDVGTAPVELARQAGTYEIVVRKPGFVSYRSVVEVKPGEEASLEATLPEEVVPIYKTFWFWGAAATVVAAATVGTYVLTRPDPQRPAPDGGGLGWVARIR